jgi:pimeloyl-ACP methyl ester carboxylesterase
VHTPAAQGTIGNGMAYLRLGHGPPLVFLPGLSAHHGPPHGLERWVHVNEIKPFSRHHETWWLQRPVGLGPDTSMSDLATGYAQALGELFGAPVDVLGHSTGGSVALQLAADHPSAVRRLVLVSSGCRLGPAGRDAQRRVASLLRRDEPRRAGAVVLSMLAAGPFSRRLMAGVGWILGAAVMGKGDPDVLVTIEAEDAFDLTPRLDSIATPVLVIGGGRDAFYGRAVFEETASLLPRGRVVVCEGKGHMGAANPRVVREVLPFLDDGAGSPPV